MAGLTGALMQVMWKVTNERGETYEDQYLSSFNNTVMIVQSRAVLDGRAWNNWQKCYNIRGGCHCMSVCSEDTVCGCRNKTVKISVKEF